MIYDIYYFNRPIFKVGNMKSTQGIKRLVFTGNVCVYQLDNIKDIYG